MIDEEKPILFKTSRMINKGLASLPKKPKYRLHVSRYGGYLIQKRVFTVFPSYYYPAHNVEVRGGWFEFRIADYGIVSKGKWEFLGYSG